MNSINNFIKNLKEQQIQEAKEKKRQLEKEFKEKMNMLIGILMTLSTEYNNSNKYRQIRIIKDIEKELVKYKTYFISYQNDFIEKTLRNTFEKDYNELYIMLKLLYNNDISKSEFTEESIDKIIHSKFFNKTLNKRIINNTSIIFNKINKEVRNKLASNDDITGIIGIVNSNFDSLTKIENRLLDTEYTRLFNEAQKKVFNDFRIENLIWCSGLEENTCGTCAGNHGQTFSISDIDMIPLHSNCNCYWEII